MLKKILIVEDELIVARDLRKTLERNGYKVVGVATSFDKAMAMVEELTPGLVLIDIFLKGSLTGIDLAKQLNIKGIPFVYVSANSNQPVLEAAKTTNPFGFIVKPFREKDLIVTLDIARYRYDNDKEMNRDLVTNKSAVTNVDTEAGKKFPSPNKIEAVCEGIIGKSALMLQVFKLIEQVAPYDTSVLLLGESGTGKEGVASCIFKQSKRNNKPFLKVNCAAIPAALMEAEFFGYEKGAFTGAADRKIGKFEYANGGTMLLDEIGEMPIDMQAKLLRTLQEKEIQRIGSSHVIKTDIRIIAATSKNLEKEVAEGRFRLDLYYRLNVFPINLPALRERKEDIPLLVNHFINILGPKSGKSVPVISPEALQHLVAYNWPGNVRELEHCIERNLLMAESSTITKIHLPFIHTLATSSERELPILSLDQIEREHILAILKKTNGKVRGPGGAAELLGIPPTTLHAKLKKLGITKSHN